MRAATLAIILALSTAPALADGGYEQGTATQSAGGSYLGGLGLITLEGPTGMFINPTSGIQPKGSLVFQTCMTFQELKGGDHVNGNSALLVYGLTDWLEVGLVGTATSNLGGPESHIEAGQFNTRARLLKDEGAMPEISVGAYLQHGDDPVTNDTIYVAASKFFALGNGPSPFGFRIHGGVRHSWFDDDLAVDDATIAYVGGEIALPHNLFLVGEVSTDDDIFAETPYSVGLQYRAPGFGMSFALVQPGNSEEAGAYVGIGVSF